MKTESAPNSLEVGIAFVAVLVFVTAAAPGWLTVDSRLNATSYPSSLGITSSLSAIQSNTPQGSTLLVASTGYARMWSLYANRTVVMLSVANATGLVPPSNVTLGDVVRLAGMWNATYVIFDSTTPWLFTGLSQYYRPQLQVGSTLIPSSLCGEGLRVVYSGGSPLVMLFKVVSVPTQNGAGCTAT